MTALCARPLPARPIVAKTLAGRNQPLACARRQVGLRGDDLERCPDRMKALVFSRERHDDQSAPVYLPGLSHLQLMDVPVPDLPNEHWVVIKSKIAGICGSDLGFLQGKPMPAAEPYFQLPVIPGHELFGEVEAVGKRVKGFHVGERVSIDPSLGCRERGFKKLCVQCRNGNLGICEHLAEGCLKPGPLIGTCGDTGGGWGEHLVAPGHPQHPLPDTICDDETSL